MDFVYYFDEVVRELFHLRGSWKMRRGVFIAQVYFTGVQALKTVFWISLCLGIVVVLGGHSTLGGVDKNIIYEILISASIRDIGPLFTSIYILMRSGMAISTELGNMTANREIDALKSMGISPVDYLVTPRIFGVVVSVIVLSIYFALFSIFGGFIVASLLLNIPLGEFFRDFSIILNFYDIALMLVKCIAAGVIVGAICSYHGLRVQSAVTEVPVRNLKAMTQSLICVLSFNILWILVFVVRPA